MAPRTAALSKSAIDSSVLEVLAELTKYPPEILDPQAHLENDLGIEPATVAEVLAVLTSRLGLPELLQVPHHQRNSAAELGGAIHAHLERARSQPGAPEMAPAAAIQPSPPPASLAAFGIQPTMDTSREEVERRVLAVFAEVTRYPAEILDPAADLEADLGIDSVKLGEVFAVLGETYGLPQQLDVPREQLRTIGSIAAALAELLGAGANAKPAAPVSPPEFVEAESATPVTPLVFAEASARPAEPTAAPMTAGPSLEEVTQQVLEVFAEVTRYPQEILDQNAHLEEDLGIDSVKLGEVFAVLGERFGLPQQLDIPREQLSSAGQIAVALHAYLASGRSAAAVADVAEVPGPSGKKVAGDGAGAIVAEVGGNGAAAANSNGSAGLVPPLAAAVRNGNNGVSAVTAAAATAAWTGGATQARPFAGRVAFVSGSGRGLGKEIACHLAQLGATVAVNSFHSRQRGIETVEEIRRAGGDAVHLWGSVAHPEQLGRIFDELEERFDRLDFLVANASNGMLARLEDITAEHWEKAFRTNIVGLHQSAMRAARLMRRQGGGKIITLSSPAAHGHVEYFGCMGPVKAAVESLTRSMAFELSPDNIQVNCVSPGPLYGELLDKWPERERLIAQWETATLAPRLCSASDVARFVAYLLSDSADVFTGSVLVMDGGISAQGF